MNISFIIILLTGFFVMNIYHDGVYINKLLSWKKYYQMAFVAFSGLSLLVFMRRHPGESQSMLYHANSIIKYLPIQKGTADVITPFFDMTATHNSLGNNVDQAQYNRIMTSGSKSTKRSVSETKKKFVASSQNWECTGCGQKLPAWFEVDHKIRLEHGGTNHVDNLEALCRDCHGKKTAMENL